MTHGLEKWHHRIARLLRYRKRGASPGRTSCHSADRTLCVCESARPPSAGSTALKTSCASTRCGGCHPVATASSSCSSACGNACAERACRRNPRRPTSQTIDRQTTSPRHVQDRTVRASSLRYRADQSMHGREEEQTVYKLQERAQDRLRQLVSWETPTYSARSSLNELAST